MPTASDNPTRAAAIGAIPTLPIFFKLKDRPVVVAGGDLPAVWKADLLAAAGARVAVFAPAPCPEIAPQHDTGERAISVIRRPWQSADLAGAVLAIGALAGNEAEAFRAAAKKASVPVNVIDVPELCDFQFGTIVDRAPLLVAITTDGAVPVLGQALRTRIEAILPPSIAEWVRAAREWRPALQARGLSFAARRRIWERFADRVLSANAAPDEADRRWFLDTLDNIGPTDAGGLFLVGLGSGNPALVTLGAVRALQSAEVIVHAADVPQSVLMLGRREAVRIEEGAATDTAATLTALVQAGKWVAWAGLGNPEVGPDWQSRRDALNNMPYDLAGASKAIG